MEENPTKMINLAKKIIAFDLDGTLTESKSPIKEDMVHLVEKLAREKLVVVISGGKFEQFKKQFLSVFNEEEFPSLFIKNLILLPTSGSQRYEYDLKTKDWKLTDLELFSEDIKEKAKKVLKKMIDSGLYDIPSNPTGEYIEDRITQLSISALGQDAPIENKKLWDPDQKKRQKMKEILEKELPETSIIIGGTTTIDILPKGFDKAKGLIRLVDKLEMNINDMIFVGNFIFPGGNNFSVQEAGIESIKVSGPAETSEVIKKWVE